MVAVGPLFLDTTILLGGLIDFGNTQNSQRILTAIAEGVVKDVHTAWHCCLEFYSVSTRLPEEYRLAPEDAMLLIKQEILARLEVHELPADARGEFLQVAAADRVVGGRIYDTHIAEVARNAGCRVLVTENKRHFLSLLRSGLNLLSSEEFTLQLDL